MERVEEIYDALPEGILQIKLFTLSDLLTALHQICGPLIDVLKEILGSCLEKQDLVVVVAVVAQIAAFLANQLAV